MQVRNISRVNFGASEYVKYTNVPEELQESKPVLEQLAKDNSAKLSISKAPETKYMPRNDLYTIIVKKINPKTKNFSFGTAALITEKGNTNPSVLEKLNERVSIAILNVQKKLVETCMNSEKTKQTFGQKVKGFFKQLLKK